MNKRGQSIIEYSLIALLVILGVVTMGPYVLRSINGHFKLWDDSVQDTFKENLIQAPANAIPPISYTCNCSAQPTGSCGSAYSGGGCAPDEEVWEDVCQAGSIQGCDGEPQYSCKPDCSCCSTFYSGTCGNITIPAGGLPSTSTISCSSLGIPGSVCTTPPSTSPNNCYYGQYIWSTQCSVEQLQALNCSATLSNPSVVCVNDSTTNCYPKCRGIFRLGASSVVACPGSATAYPALSSSVPITIVSNENNPGLGGGTYCNGSPCEYYCAPTYFFDPKQGDCSNSLEVAPVHDSTRYQEWGAYVAADKKVEVDNADLGPGLGMFCNTDPNETISTVTLTAVPPIQPQTGINTIPAAKLGTPDGCGNPGEPSQWCNISTS